MQARKAARPPTGVSCGDRPVKWVNASIYDIVTDISQVIHNL